MSFDAAALGHSSLRSCLGELGDKTFLLTAVFAAWCPWVGVRKTDDRLLQTCLVLLGAFVGLALHSTLLLTVLARSTITNYTWTCEVLSFLSLFLLGLRAKIELGRTTVGEKRNAAKQAVPVNPFQADAEEGPQPKVNTKWNDRAFGACALVPSPAEPEETPLYGSLAPPVTSADGIFSNRVSDRTVSHVCAFFVTLVVVFLAEAEDKSQEAYMVDPAKSDEGATVVLGYVLGLLPATVLALGFGWVLERQSNDSNTLFFVTLVFTGVGLVSLSQTLLHTSMASPVSSVRQALLAVVTRVQSGAGM